MGFVLKELLKSLCCCNGWSYGVFWSFDQRNSMLLTMEDVYHDEEIGSVVGNMLRQVQILGEGIVGRAALSGKTRWYFSDADNGGCCSAGISGSKEIYEDNSEIHKQFSSGIKTIAVIPVESGVMQFGSTRKISETPKCLDQMKGLFSEMENLHELASSDILPSSLNYESCDLNEWFASFCNDNITPMHSGSCNELMEIAYSSLNCTHSSSFQSDFQQEKVDPLYMESSYLTNSLQIGTEAQVRLTSNPNDQFQQVSSKSAFSVKNLTAATPCISTWSNEGSILTSLESQFASEMGVLNSPVATSTKETAPAFCGHAEQDLKLGSSGTSTYNTGGSVCAEKLVQGNSARLMNNRHSGQSILAGKAASLGKEAGLQNFLQEFKLDDFADDLSSCFSVENILEYFVTPEHELSKMAPTVDGNVSLTVGVTSVSSSLDGDVTLDVPFTQRTIQERATGSGNDLFEYLGFGYGSGQAGDCQKSMMKPIANGARLDIGTGVSECISELDVNSVNAPRKGLFSELGLEELLSGNASGCNSTFNIDDQFSSAKRRRVESSLLNQVESESISCTSSSMLMQPACHKDKASNFASRKELFPKSQVGLWIDDSYSINNGNALPSKPKKPEESAKAARKRARPGESTRPRPKDRQQIQDRIKELKGLIPDGGKCSIDALLGRTIKYMLFLQSVTKYADKLKQTDKPRLISKEQKTFQQDNNTSAGGATWALEVGDQSTICPIIVEDLSPPGLMLIEMLCEDQGFFLEIADVIRGFELNILKGVMESREDKIWAHFIVEAKTHITRIEIFWSLVQLLQLTSTSGMDSTNQPCNAMSGRVPPLNNYQQPALPCPLSVADALQ